jgi:hypothetical protein
VEGRKSEPCRVKPLPAILGAKTGARRSNPCRAARILHSLCSNQTGPVPHAGSKNGHTRRALLIPVGFDSHRLQLIYVAQLPHYAASSNVFLTQSLSFVPDSFAAFAMRECSSGESLARTNMLFAAPSGSFGRPVLRISKCFPCCATKTTLTNLTYCGTISPEE